MGICFTLYCENCREYFDLGKTYNVKYYAPQILKSHENHTLKLFNDCICCKFEDKYLDYKFVRVEEVFNNDDTKIFTEDELNKFEEDTYHECDGCKCCL